MTRYSGRLRDIVPLSKETRESRLKPGGSNAGKYPNVTSFAGPAGGAPKGTFPINTRSRAKAALLLAHNAPNPSGIRQAVSAKNPGI